MERKLELHFCSHFIPEISHILKNGNYHDVKLVHYPSKCNNFSKSTNLEKTTLVQIPDLNTDIIVIGNKCRNKLRDDSPNTKLINLEQCFDLFLNNETVCYYISKGYYLITNGWLKTVEHHIQGWGFDEVTAKTFFRSSMNAILLLDTGIPFDYKPKLEMLSEYMGLPYEIIPVGLNHATLIIESYINNWRIKTEEDLTKQKLIKISKQNADYLLVFNQLEILVGLIQEEEIIQVGFNLLNTLFAPSHITFKKILNDIEEKFEFEGFHNENVFDEHNAFNIDIYHHNVLLGVFEIKGIQFPQYLPQYNNNAKVVSQIFGLAIANAREYELINKQKEQLRTYSVELEISNSSKDKFFSIIAHDLKGPLGNFNLIMQMLQSDYDLLNEHDKKEILQKLADSSGNIFSLLENLLEWSRSQRGNMPFNPDSQNLYLLCNNVFNLLKTNAERKNIKLLSKIPNDFEIIADTYMLHTILRNLVSNALKFTRHDGEIEVGVAYKQYNNRKVECIYVQDNGIGIDKKSLDKLFKINNQVKTLGTDAEKGTGLGLILCKEFVEKHHGEIWVESEVGKGSTFYFSLNVRIN